MEKIKQESLEMFMLKRKILKELEQMDENEDFIMPLKFPLRNFRLRIPGSPARRGWCR